MTPFYRPEVDGLRAIAVLAVVLFHAGIGSAGFVGVDVFFVISGYLITSLLLREWNSTGEIDLPAFYGRRVRRIVPAATLVIICVLAAARWLLPGDAQSHAAFSAGAASVFVANIFFQYASGGYFDMAAAEMPLLHLWSLSVEEQFYLLWPALLLLVMRYRPTWLKATIAMLGLASLGLAYALKSAESSAAFYSMPARFWELAAGGLVATMPARAAPRWLAPATIAGVLAACVWPLGNYVGLAPLPVVVATTALVLAVHGGARNAWLASAPMVGLGRVSYGLYLWHWPLLAFHRATSIGDGALSDKLLLCVLALGFAIVSYYFVEQPFRRLSTPKWQTLRTGARIAGIIATSAIALGWYAQNGGAPDNPLALKAQGDGPSVRCHKWPLAPVAFDCPMDAKTVVWGDSMAYAWMPAFPSAAEATRDACAPLVGYLWPEPKRSHFLCRDHNAATAALGADYFVLAANWSSYPSIDLGPTLDALGNRQVLVIGPTPRMREKVPRCIRRHAERACALARAEFVASAKPILAKLRAAAAGRPNVQVIDVTDYFCDAESCPPVLNGVPMYWDTHHVSKTAAQGFPHWAEISGLDASLWGVFRDAEKGLQGG
jgi:peptidoglycan/LPS O-acetylase OafA/YrhL